MTNLKPVEVTSEIKPIVSVFKVGIKNAADMNKAVEVLSQLNKILDRLTEEKEKITKPLNATLKEVRSRYKGAEDELSENIEKIRRMMTDYQTEQVRIQREEEAKIEARVGEGKGKLKVETAVRKMDELEKAEEQIVTGEGLVKFKEVKKFEVVDLKKMPVKFLMPNDMEIRKAMNNGEAIPGVRYYTEQMPVNHR